MPRRKILTPETDFEEHVKERVDAVFGESAQKPAAKVDVPLDTVQLLDGDGEPLTDKMPFKEFTRRAEAVTERGSNQPEGGDSLRSLVARIERLEADKASIMADLKELYAEARGEGYMVKVLRLVIRRRKRGKTEIREEDEVVNAYEEMLS